MTQGYHFGMWGQSEDALDSSLYVEEMAIFKLEIHMQFVLNI